MTAPGEDELRALVRQLAADHDPAGDRAEFLRARFDAGLAWVHFPVGLGGLGLARATQSVVDSELAAHGAPDNDPRRIGIGLVTSFALELLVYPAVYMLWKERSLPKPGPDTPDRFVRGQ